MDEKIMKPWVYGLIGIAGGFLLCIFFISYYLIVWSLVLEPGENFFSSLNQAIEIEWYFVIPIIFLFLVSFIGGRMGGKIRNKKARPMAALIGGAFLSILGYLIVFVSLYLWEYLGP